METINVLIVEPGKEPRLATIPHNLQSFKEIVGGYLELAPAPWMEQPGLQNVVAYCNEEGKLIDLPPNRWIGGDWIAGNIVVCAGDREGNEISLTDKQAFAMADLLSLAKSSVE